MATTPLGDIASARFHIAIAGTNASVASGGANARLGTPLGPFAHNIRVRQAWWTPTGADQAATVATNYRRMSLYNGGASGTATATTSRVASLNLTASRASFSPVEFSTLDVTVSAGAVIYWSQETVGAADANGTVLQAGQLALAYEVM